MPPLVAHLVLAAIVATSIVLMLVRPRGLPEVYWIGAGVVLLLLLGLEPLGRAARAVTAGTDVYLFLVGMMLLSGLAREQGVFTWVASVAVHHARGRRARLFAWVYAIGTVVTVCMSNDATAVVLTPAVLAAVRRADVPARPYLFACAMIANAASFVLPVSNPANLVVFHGRLPSLGHWLAAFALPSLLAIGTTYLVLAVYFRADLRGRIESREPVARLSRHGRLVLAGLGAVVVALIAASVRDMDLGLPTFVAAVLVTAVVAIGARMNPLRLVREISGSTLLLVAGLFVLVDAVQGLGALRYTAFALAWLDHRPPASATMLAALGVGIANNLVNNLPLGLIVSATLASAHPSARMTRAVLIGVDLGPNLSVTGSLATILWLLALRREQIRVSAWSFLKVGMLAMPLALVASIAGLLLVGRLTGP